MLTKAEIPRRSRKRKKMKPNTHLQNHTQRMLSTDCEGCHCSISPDLGSFPFFFFLGLFSSFSWDWSKRTPNPREVGSFEPKHSPCVICYLSFNALLSAKAVSVRTPWHGLCHNTSTLSKNAKATLKKKIHAALLSPATINSSRNISHPPEMEKHPPKTTYGCSGVGCNIKRPHSQSSHPIECIKYVIFVSARLLIHRMNLATPRVFSR